MQQLLSYDSKNARGDQIDGEPALILKHFWPPFSWYLFISRRGELECDVTAALIGFSTDWGRNDPILPQDKDLDTSDSTGIQIWILNLYLG